MISGTTTICGVIGNPIGHSLSPHMHNSAFQSLGLDFTYVAFRVEKVAEAIAGIRGLGLRGVSVTIPHKIAVMEFLDEIEPLAAQTGAVNTITNENGKLIGSNTDGYGALNAIEQKERLDDKRILVLGVGGAARGVLFAIAGTRSPRSLTIAGRKPDKTRALATELTPRSSCFVSTCGFDDELRDRVDQADVIINTTPIGMHPEENETPIPEDWITEQHLVFDMIYNPLKTLLLKNAEARFARVVPGVPMFVHQGALQFERWTGRSAPLDVMETAVLNALQPDT